MRYIRTYETEEKFLTDKDSTSRGFRLKPTLYKYSEAGDHVLLENDDPRKHGDSTYMEITLDSDAEFSFYIGNAPNDTQATMNCSIDWGDGTVETKTITKDDKGFKLSHSYKAGSYKIELYDVERDYSVVGDYKTLISHLSSVKRVILGGGVVRIGKYTFYNCTSLTSIHIPESVTSIFFDAFRDCSSLTSINIPEGVTNIGHHVFNNCSSLKSISSLNTTTPTLGISVFANLPTNGTLHIKPGATGYDAWLSKLPSGWTIVEDL